MKPGATGRAGRSSFLLSLQPCPSTKRVCQRSWNELLDLFTHLNSPHSSTELRPKHKCPANLLISSSTSREIEQAVLPQYVPQPIHLAVCPAAHPSIIHPYMYVCAVCVYCDIYNYYICSPFISFMRLRLLNPHCCVWFMILFYFMYFFAFISIVGWTVSFTCW